MQKYLICYFSFTSFLFASLANAQPDWLQIPPCGDRTMQFNVPNQLAKLGVERIKYMKFDQSKNALLVFHLSTNNGEGGGFLTFGKSYQQPEEWVTLHLHPDYRVPLTNDIDSPEKKVKIIRKDKGRLSSKYYAVNEAEDLLEIPGELDKDKIDSSLKLLRTLFTHAHETYHTKRDLSLTSGVFIGPEEELVSELELIKQMVQAGTDYFKK